MVNLPDTIRTFKIVWYFSNVMLFFSDIGLKDCYCKNKLNFLLQMKEGSSKVCKL